jgi:hypothetical protein
MVEILVAWPPNKAMQLTGPKRLAADCQRRSSNSMKPPYKLAAALLALTAGLLAIPVVGYTLENRQLRAERARVLGLVHIGQSITEAQATLRQNGFRFHGDTPTRYLDYQQLLVVLGDTNPSRLDTLFYVLGRENPLRTQSPYASIAARLDGVITGID